MKTPEKRILRVSEMIADNVVEAMLDFRHCTPQTNGLWDAMETLNPDIKRLDDQHREILRNRNLSESLLNSLTVDQADAAYAAPAQRPAGLGRPRFHSARSEPFQDVDGRVIPSPATGIVRDEFPSPRSLKRCLTGSTGPSWAIPGVSPQRPPAGGG